MAEDRHLWRFGVDGRLLAAQILIIKNIIIIIIIIIIIAIYTRINLNRFCVYRFCNKMKNINPKTIDKDIMYAVV